MSNDRQIWDDIWKEIKRDISEDRLKIQQEVSSVRWKKIEKIILDKYGSFKGLDVIEIGAGRGENSLLMSLKGANITLLDYSEIALEKARLLFDDFNCKAKFIQADVFDIPKNLLNNYDVSMSFGLAEHFTYPQRQQIFNSHFLLLKQNGLSFISVPNAFCFPYRIVQKALKLFHKLKLSEIPFTHSELSNIARSSGYRSYEIVGSSFIAALDEFLIKNTMYFVAKSVGSKSFLKSYSNIMEEKPTIFDNYLGYALIFIGYKQSLYKKEDKNFSR